MTEREKRSDGGMANDSLTTTHLEKSLTTAHIKQQLQHAAQEPQANSSASSGATAPAPISPSGKQSK